MSDPATSDDGGQVKKCAHQGCSTRPSFAEIGSTKPKFCLKHAHRGMVDVVNKKCARDGCSTQPCFNEKGSKKAKFCARHAEQGMVDVVNRKCVHPGCFTQPNFGLDGSGAAQFCAAHAAAGMVDVKKRTCSQEGCFKQPCFGVKGSRKAELCVQHAKRGMVDVLNKKCAHGGCSIQPYFGVPGTKKAKFCSQHALPGMVDVINRTCIVEDCVKQPHYGVPGSRKAEFCAQHANEGTVDVTSKTCAHEGCFTKPFFGEEGTKRGEYCKLHMKRGMVNVWSISCAYKGCTTFPSFGVEGTTKREFCAAHKLVGMVNLQRKKCSQATCHGTPAYAMPGSIKPDFCELHAKAGMVDVRRTRCAHPSCRKLGMRGQDGKSAALCALHVNPGATSPGVLQAASKSLATSKSSTSSLAATAVVTRLSSAGSEDGSAKRARLAPREELSPTSTSKVEAAESSPEIRAVEEPLGEKDVGFEQRVAATPRDPSVWVQYANYKRSIADAEAARSIAERGLEAVPTRKKKGRRTLWGLLLKVEHERGTIASFKKVFRRACEDSEASKMFLRIGTIHDKGHEAGFCEKCEAVFRSSLKKDNFRHSKEVWMSIHLSRLRRGDAGGAWETLQLSFEHLPREDHLYVISRFAQRDMKYGSVESGREIHESIIESYPERLDLWNGYIDAETETGNTQAARNLLERLAGMELTATSMLEVLRMRVDFETLHGDEAGIKAAKRRAERYTAS